MKKIIIAMAVMFCAASGLQAQKIAFVNTSKVIDTLPAKDSAELALQSYAQAYESSLYELEQELNAKQIELEKAKATPGVSQIRIDLLTQNLQKLYQTYQNTESAMNQDLQAQRAKLLTPIFDEIKVAVAAVAKTKGYTSAIDNSSGIILYMGNNADDITDAVIKYMLAPKPAVAAPAPKK
ncbi:MAG: OmpH family outer membrane protein [Bacteroidia bacterium]|nr:OmpH family outer membrane protein [Bacteroidia bacterium]